MKHIEWMIFVSILAMIVAVIMAQGGEALVRVEPEGHPNDGDIHRIVRSVQILDQNTQRLCRKDHAPRLANGNIKTNSYQYHYDDQTMQYKFVRTSQTSMDRIDRLAGTTNTITATPNAQGEYADWKLWLKRRKAKIGRHKIYNRTGEEIAFGGRRIIKAVTLGNVWDIIEANTSEVRADYQAGKYTPATRKQWLIVDINDKMTKAQAAEWSAIDTNTGSASHYINWRDDLGLTANQILKIENQVNGRDRRSLGVVPTNRVEAR